MGLAAEQEKRAPSVVRKKKDKVDRDAMIDKYMPFANSIVSKVFRTISGVVDFDELASYSRIGLIEAVDRYDPAFKVDFKTFAYYRIKGAIYDGLRNHGWLSRTQYAKNKFQEGANEYLKNFSEVGGISQENDGDKSNAIFSVVNQLASIYIISLDAAEGLQLVDDQAVSQETITEIGQAKDIIRNKVTSLPEKERQLIEFYYYDGLTLEEVGEKMGLSKSWASRLHARALKMLQKGVRTEIETT